MTEISFKNFRSMIEDLKATSQPSAEWTGKKIYLGYSDQKGWAVYELSLWDRICRNLFGKYEETHLEYIKERVRALPQSEIEAININQDHDAFQALLKTSKILVEVLIISKKIETSKPKNNPIAVPRHNWNVGEYAPPSRSKRISAPKLATSRQDRSLTTYIETLLKGARVPLKPVEFPVRLTNCGNRCYLNSVLQLILCQVEIKQKILDAFDENVRNMKEFDAINTQLVNIHEQQAKNGNTELRQEELLKQWAKLNLEMKKHHVLKLLAALVLHLEAQKSNEYSEIVDDLVDQIRSELFRSELHNDLKEGEDEHQQQDAGIIIEIMFKDLLGNLLETVTVDRSNTHPELTAKRTDLNSALIVNFNKSKGEEIPTLAHLIAQPFELETITRDFDQTSKTGQIIGPATRTTATSQTQITHLSDIVVVHINRTTFDSIHGPGKTNRAVALPRTIDLAPYCAQIRGESSYQYELIGYNVHIGPSLRGGHYTAYFKTADGLCFACDDLDRGHYQGMSEAEFYGEDSNPAASQAYLAMFRRIKVPAGTAAATGISSTVASKKAPQTTSHEPSKTATVTATSNTTHKETPKKNSATSATVTTTNTVTPVTTSATTGTSSTVASKKAPQATPHEPSKTAAVTATSTTTHKGNPNKNSATTATVTTTSTSNTPKTNPGTPAKAASKTANKAPTTTTVTSKTNPGTSKTDNTTSATV